MDDVIYRDRFWKNAIDHAWNNAFDLPSTIITKNEKLPKCHSTVLWFWKMDLMIDWIKCCTKVKRKKKAKFKNAELLASLICLIKIRIDYWFFFIPDISWLQYWDSSRIVYVWWIPWFRDKCDFLHRIYKCPVKQTIVNYIYLSRCDNFIYMFQCTNWN